MGGCVSWLQRPSVCCICLYERPVRIVIYFAPYISLITLQRYVTYGCEGLFFWNLVYRSQLHARSNQWKKLPPYVRSHHTCCDKLVGCLRWAWREKHETINRVDGWADERRHLFVCRSRTLLSLHVVMRVYITEFQLSTAQYMCIYFFI